MNINDKYENLYRSINNLKTKIKKLSLTKNTSSIKSYKISCPKIDYTKKYIALLFDENFENNDNSFEQKKSFINIKNNNVINYSITFFIEEIPQKSCYCYVYLGIRDKYNSKVRIINCSKCIFDISNTGLIYNNCIVINNNVIYSAQEGDELCLIANLKNRCKIISKKSIIKILNV